MATLLQWLEAQGNAAINVAASRAKDIIRNFSDKAVELEKQYRALYLVRENYRDKKVTFPRQTETLFNDASGMIEKERTSRLLLLRAMKAAGVNPADYGLSVYGLRKVDVDAAYPGLRYNPAELNAVPALVLGGGILLSALLLTAAIAAVIERCKTINYAEMQAAVYEKQGYTPEAAMNQAKKDAEKMLGKQSVFGDMADAAKWGAIGAAVWLVYREMGK